MNHFYLLLALLSHSIYAVPYLPTPTTYNQSPAPQDWTQRQTETPYLALFKSHLSPRQSTNLGIDDLADWLNNLVTPPPYTGPCPVDSTRNPRLCNGETCFRQRLSLYNLPYGVFGVLSHAFHFYTFACLGFGRSPWRPRKRLDGRKFDVVLSVTTIAVTTTAVVISFWNPRFTSLDPFCRMNGKYWWTYLLIVTKAYLGLASGFWSYKMNKIARKRKLDSPNQADKEDGSEDPQSVVNHVPEAEFAGGLVKTGWFSGRGGWKAVGILFVLTLMVGMTGLGLVMWTHSMTVLSIICAVLIVLIIGYSRYLSKRANERKLTKSEAFLRKMSWNIILVIIFSWADLVLGLAAQNISGRPEQGIYIFALYFVGKELPFLSA